MEYTKGEWSFTPALPQDEEFKTDDGVYLAFVRSIKRNHKHNADFPIARVTGETNKEVKANARLIAQAPKLYEACKLALADIDRTGYAKVPHIVKMQEAIARVKGK